MPINLGDVNFGVGANTAGLQRSIRDVEAFSRVVDTASASAASNTAALRRQEKAAIDAAVRIQQLNQSMSRVKDSEKFVQASTEAFNRFSASMTRGTLSSLEFQRAQERLKISLANNQRAFKDFATSVDGGTNSNARFVNYLKGIQAASVLTTGPLGGVATRVSAFTSVVSASGFAVGAFVAGAAAMALGLWKIGNAAKDAGVQMKSYASTLTAVTGSSEEGNKELENSIKIARLAGTAIDSTIPSYAKFTAAAEGTTLQGEKAQRIFTQFAKASSILNLSADDSTGIFRALEQMISKGTVQAEELRGQLGDRLPGAFSLAARAMGVTTRQLGDMMKKGELLTVDLLPKLAEELTKTFHIPEGPINTYTAALNNMGTAWTQLMADVDKKFDISGKVQKMMEAVTKGLDWVRGNLEEVVAYTAILGSALAILTGNFVVGLGLMAVSINKFGDQIKVVQDQSGTLKDYMNVVWTDISNAAKTAAENTKSYWENVPANISRKFSEAVGTSSNWFNELDTMATDGFNKIVAAIATTVEIFPKIPQGILDMMRGIWNDILTTAEEKLNAVINSTVDAANAIKSLGGLLNVNPIDASKWHVDLSGFKSDVTGAAEDMSKAFNDAFTKNSQIKYFENSQREITTLASDYAKSVQTRANAEADARNAARDALIEKRDAWATEKATTAEIERRKKIQTEGDYESDAARKKREREAEKLKKEAERRQAAMENILLQNKQLQRDVDALGMGDREQRLAKEMNAREDAVRKYSEQLRKAGVDSQFIQQETQKLYDLMARKDAMEEARKGVDAWRDTWVDAFDKVSGSIVDGMFEGKNALDSFKNVAKDVVKDIIKTWLQLRLLNPIKNAIFGTDLPTYNAIGTNGYNGMQSAMTAKSSPAIGAVEKAFTMLGSSERSNASGINSFLNKGGVNLDAAQNAWCAAFVNSSLQQVGIKGSGSNLANSFQNWGNKVDLSQVMRGDVLLKSRGLGAADAGGHVGLATGNSRMFGNQQQLEMISGNTANKVMTTWTNATDLQARRATEMANTFNGVNTQSSTFGQNISVANDNFRNLTPAINTTGQGMNNLGQGMNSFGQALQNPGQGGGGLFSGIGNFFKSIFGGGVAPTSPGWAPNTTFSSFLGLRKGGAVEGGFQPIRRAANGMITKPTLFQTPSGTVQGGEAGTEAIMPLQKDASGSLGIKASIPSGGNVIVNVYNYAENTKTTKKQSNNSKGDTVIDLIIEQTTQSITQDIAGGGSGINKALEGRYGLNASKGLKKTATS